MVRKYKWLREGIWGDYSEGSPQSDYHYSKAINGIDPEIRTLVKALNRSGIQTHSSCAGHPWGYDSASYKGFQAGYISFSKEIKLDKKMRDKISRICRKCGLSDFSLHEGGIDFRSLDPGYSNLSPLEATRLDNESMGHFNHDYSSYEVEDVSPKKLEVE